jgi:hypothetical protein
MVMSYIMRHRDNLDKRVEQKFGDVDSKTAFRLHSFDTSVSLLSYM